MTRNKSRVARRSRRRARRGTRKQSGGMLFGLFGSNSPTDGNGAPAPAPAAAPAAAAVDKPSFFSGLFDKKSAADKPSFFSGLFDTKSDTVNPQGGGRKTRHRRRSPRHHRK